MTTMKWWLVLGMLCCVIQPACLFPFDNDTDKPSTEDLVQQRTEPSLTLDSATLIGNARRGEMEPGDVLSVDIRASEVVKEPRVAIQILGRGEDGAVESLHSDAFDMTQTGRAQFDWDVIFNGQAPGVYEIFAEASFQDQSVTSDSVRVVWAPQIDEINLVGFEPGTVFEEGDSVQFEVVGRGLKRQNLFISVIASSLTTDAESAVLDTPVSFDDTEGVQRGMATWQVAGGFLDKIDTHEIIFHSEIGDEPVSSEPFLVEVLFLLDAFEVLAVEESGERRISPNERIELRFIESIKVVLEGRGLEGRSIRFNANPSDLTAQSIEIVAESNTVSWTFDPPRGFTDAPFFDLGVSASLGTKSMRGTVQLRRWGFLRCAFLHENGAQISNMRRFRSPVGVLLHVETWGVPDRSILMTVFEDDPGSDDTVLTRRSPLVDDIANEGVSLSFINDGVANSEAEYRFSVRIGEAGCQSQQIIVVKP